MMVKDACGGYTRTKAPVARVFLELQYAHVLAHGQGGSQSVVGPRHDCSRAKY
jgi:hypothetical protein